MGDKLTSSRYKKHVDREMLAKRRKQAIAWHRSGLTQYRIAKRLGVSFEAVSNWIEAYKKNGMAGLESLGKPGPKPQARKRLHRMVKAKKIQESKSLPRYEEVPSSPKNPEAAKTGWRRIFKLIGK